MSESSGLKMGSVKKYGTIPKLKEYVVLCSKTGIQGMKFDGIPKDKWDSEYNIFLKGLTKSSRQIIGEAISTSNSHISIDELDKISVNIQLRSVSDAFKETGLPADQKFSWCFENAWRICRCATSASVLKLAKEKKKINTNAVFFVRTESGLTYFVRSRFSDTSSKPRVQLIFADDNATIHPGDLWTDIRTTGLDGEGGVSFKNGKKPLKLLMRLLKSKTGDGDLVMDFYSGSGSFAHATIMLNAEDGGNRNIKPGRDNPEDLLFQVLVDWGVDLTLPIRSEMIQGKTVFFVNEEPYDLIACFNTGITEDFVKELARYEPMRVVFRDNGFVSDAVKINVDQIFRQLSSATDVKSI